MSSETSVLSMPAAHAMRHDTVERSQRAQPAIQKVLLVPWHGSAPHNLTRWLVARRAKVCACVACSRHTPLFCTSAMSNWMLGILLLSVALWAGTGHGYEWDDRGYVLYCPCMGEW